MMNVIIGVDVGNATTEAAMAHIGDGALTFIKSSLTKTTGTKGTKENVDGIKRVINDLICGFEDLTIERILLNDAAPVIADFAMDTITETVITDSAMIGHDPDTPGGIGLGIGYTVSIDDDIKDDRQYIVVVPPDWDFIRASHKINERTAQGIRIGGLIVKKDEGTLINNRLDKKVPIVDEVQKIEKIPMNSFCAVEVAPPGYSVDTLSNPYGIATVFQLNAEETEYCKYVAKALIGNRSAVVIKTPSSDIKERIIPSGNIEIIGERYSTKIAVDSGADHIMQCITQTGKIVDIKGEPGTNIGGMLEKIKINMSKSCNMARGKIAISDLFATDARTSVPVKGGLADEAAMETGVAVAAMIHADETFMKQVAQALMDDLKLPVEVSGIEGEMALAGALTTPGTKEPMVMVDIGAGSTDAAYIDEEGHISCVHLAGAGNMITMLIQSELNLKDFECAEQIKKAPLAKVDSLYRIKYENGNVEYRETPFDAQYYGQTVTVTEDGMLQIVNSDKPMEEIRRIRREAKDKVLVHNVKRALDLLGVDRDLCRHVVLVGGSVLDLEISNILTKAMEQFKITAGKGNIRGREGPRNAVATGLIQKYYEKEGTV